MDVSAELFAVAQRYLRRVRRSGSENVMALCPFHDDHSASFAMSLVTGVYFCHACHAKGTLRTFFRNLGLEASTVELHHSLLIENAAKNLPAKPDPRRPGEVWAKELNVIGEGLLGLFDHDVTHLLPDFTPETLRHFDVGWDGWHQRLTYPIRDIKGDLVAISGRAVHAGQTPRYKIYDEEYRMWELPPRPGWNKRSAMWHVHEVYPPLVTSTNPRHVHVVVVEGFKGCMWVWQAGIKNVVALLGSYLSWEHSWILERSGAPVYLFLDHDSAGRRGQLDAAKRLTRAGLTTYIVEYPDWVEDDAQPDSLTSDEVLEQVARAPRYEQWLYRRRT